MWNVEEENVSIFVFCCVMCCSPIFFKNDFAQMSKPIVLSFFLFFGHLSLSEFTRTVCQHRNIYIYIYIHTEVVVREYIFPFFL